MITQAVWKYQLSMMEFQTVPMPEGAEILCVQLQYGVPTLWARVTLVPKPRTLKDRRFRIAGTGNLYGAEGPPIFEAYIGTVQDGLFVWHVFEIQDGKP